MKVERKDIEVHRNEGLEHIPADYRENYRYSAMWSHEFYMAHRDKIRGYPAGSDRTEDLARFDLVRRTNAESGTKFAMATVEGEAA